jgi:hypothetical protein
VTGPGVPAPGRGAEGLTLGSADESIDEIIRGLGVKLEITSNVIPILEAPPPNVAPEAPSICLDTKDWIALAQVRSGHSEGTRFRPCYEWLLDATTSGQVRVVLSAGSYMELNLAIPVHRVRQRADLADVMTEITRFWNIRCRSNLLEAQFEQGLHDRFDRPLFPARPEVFGPGVTWAFEGTVLDTPVGGGGEMAEAGTDRWGSEGYGRFVKASARMLEYCVLRGARPQDVPLMPGYDLDPILRHEQERLARDQDLQRRLVNEPGLKAKLDDILDAREIYWELGPDLPRLLGRATMSVEGFFYKGKEWISDFVNSLPTIAVERALRRYGVLNSRPWKVNDQRDLDHLSLGVPYCDVVVTDRAAADALRRAHLDERFGVIVLSDLAQLPDVRPR